MKRCSKHPDAARYKNGNCVMCHRASVKASRAKNPEKYRAYYKAWEAKNRDKVNASHREWHIANPERSLAIKKGWQDRHPERRTHHRRQYQLKKVLAMPRWADSRAILAVYERARKLTADTGVEHHVDHIVPISHPLVCGLHVADNLQAIAATDNRKKSNTFCPEFLNTN